MITLALALVVGFLFGVFALLGFGTARALRSDGWDDSNVFNFWRLLWHVFMHPEDFGKMWYLTPDQLTAIRLAQKHNDLPAKRPFWYISKDEYSEVLDSRPDE